MIYLKYFESKSDIEFICRKYGVTNYTINPDGSIDVDGNVDLTNKSLTKFPIKFRNVTGYFNCGVNELTSLEGSPENVGRNFSCSYNKLKSLKGGPNYVGNDYSCNDNKLISLKGAPKRINDNFYCGYNQLETLEYIPSIGGYLNCRYNKLTNLLSLKSNIKGDIYLINNPLPKEILDNLDLIKEIIKWQNDYSIWNRDGTLNKNNFQELINDL